MQKKYEKQLNISGGAKKITNMNLLNNFLIKRIVGKIRKCNENKTNKD